MIIAQEKRRTNMAEYVIYMWQVEDLIRACGFDPEEIERQIVSRFDLPEEELQRLRQWYLDMAEMMKAEQLTEKGHLQINRNVLNDMADLHYRLINQSRDPLYIASYYKTLPYVVELRAKAGAEAKGEIETCFEALYGVLLLRLQAKTIGEDTLKAVGQISTFIVLLTDRYHRQDQEQE